MPTAQQRLQRAAAERRRRIPEAFEPVALAVGNEQARESVLAQRADRATPKKKRRRGSNFATLLGSRGLRPGTLRLERRTLLGN